MRKVTWLLIPLSLLMTPLFAVVNPNGSFSTSIPIEIPAGRNGVQPQLALQYNSNGDNGILGQGWFLSGIPVITRVHNGQGIHYFDRESTYNGNDTPPTFAITNIGAKPDWGGKLVLVSHNGANAIYHTERESYTRYIAECSPAYSWCEPVSWTVIDPSGLKMEFGKTVDSSVPDGPNLSGAMQQHRIWALNRVTDLQGNFYTISYALLSSGEIYPEDIEYTQGNGTQTIHSIGFLYESRQDVSIDHLGASAYRTVYQSKRLKWIYVISNGMPVRKYKMFYGHTGTTGTLVDADTYAPSTGRSRLTAVQEYGSDGMSTLPAQVFGYEDGGTLELSHLSNTLRPSGTAGIFPVNLHHIWGQVLTGDFNGDGFIDLISNEAWSGSGVGISQSNGSTFTPFVDVSIAGEQVRMSYTKIGDFNGDGKADLLFEKCIREERRGNYSVCINNPVVAISNGAAYYSFITIPVEISHNAISGIGPFTYCQLGDFNGDGLTDIFLNSGVNNEGQLDVWISNGNSFSRIILDQTPHANSIGLQANWQDVRLGDFNGDGKTDLFAKEGTEVVVWISNGQSITPLYNLNLYLPDIMHEYYGLWNSNPDIFELRQGIADLNGDGKADVLTRGFPGYNVNISDGKAQTFQSIFNIYHYDLYDRYGFYEYAWGDLNNDGLVDMITDFYLFLSKGTSVVEVASYFPGSDIIFWSTPKTGDIDGDGKTDIFFAYYDSVNPSTNRVKVFSSTSDTPDLLTSIDNGSGGVTTIVYKPAPQVPGAVDPIHSVYPNVSNSAPRQLVTQVTVADGRGASYGTAYQYHNGRLWNGPLNIRRDMGFEWVREVNMQTGAYTQTWHLQNNPYMAYTVAKIESFAGGAIPAPTAAANYARLMSRTTNTWSMHESFGEFYLMRLDAQQTQVYEFGQLVHTKRQFTTYYDESPYTLALPHFVVDEADGTETVVSEFQYALPDFNNWILNRVTYMATRRGSAAGEILNQVQFIYDGTCSNVHNLCKRHDWLVPFGTAQGTPTGPEKWITTSFTYDIYGNVTGITDALGHSSHIEYDLVYHTYPVLVRNALGHEVTSVFDERYGALLTQIDPNGGITEQVLDIFGRPVESRVNGLLTQTVHYNDHLTGNPLTQYIETRIVDPSLPDGYTFARNYYDGLGRTYRKESSGPTLAGVTHTLVTETGFDWAGRKAAESHPYLYPRDLPVFVGYEYDTAGRVTFVHFPEGSSAEMSYYFYTGQHSTYTEEFDPEGHRKLTVRDARGRTVRTTEGEISTVANQYDALGQLTRVTDADGHITTIHYDSLGRKIAMSEPNTGVWTYAYDDAGNLTAQTDPKAQAIGFAYDALGRLTDKILPAGGTNVHYTYDNSTVNGIGRLTQIADATGVMQYSYNMRGNVTTWRQTVAGKIYSFQAEYDLQNRPTKLIYPDGEFTQNFYAESGHLKQVRLGNPGGDNAPVVTYYGPETTENPDVLQLNRLTGNNVLTKIGFDRRTLKAVSLQTTLNDAGHTVVEDVTFTPDSVGNITQVIDNLNANKSQMFEYDSLYRLTRANSVAYGNLTYSYSPGGNLLSKEGVTLSYGNPQHPQAVTQAGANSYSYDANANMVTRNGRELIYDSEDRLTQIAIAGVAKHTFAYNHSGQRVVKAREDGTTVINLSGLYEVMKLPDSSERHTKYIFGISGEMLSQITRDGATVTVAQSGIYNQNLLALSTFHSGLQGTIFNAFYGTQYLFAGTQIAKRTLLILFILVCLALFVAILHSRLRDEQNNYAKAHPYMAKFAPLVLVFAVFEFGFLGCSVSDTSVQGAQPWIDLPTTPTDSGGFDPVDVSDGTISDTTTRGFPVFGAYFMHPNHVGSPSIITNAAGTQVITQVMHRPYGEIVRNSPYSNGPDIARYKFTGHEEDAESGLVYMNARFYDPAIGRFITSDSEFGGSGTQGFNRHMYATGNPIKYTDPTGHNAEEAGRWDEKGNERVQESSQSESGWQRNEERSGKSEASGVESARESQGGSSAREHADVDRGDRGERAAASSSNASDNSQLNQMISSITSTQFDTGSTGGTPLLIAQAAPVPVTTPGSGPVATDTGSSTADTNGDLPTYAKFAGVTVAVVAVIVLAVKFKNWGAARAAAGQTGMNVARALAGKGALSTPTASNIFSSMGSFAGQTMTQVNRTLTANGFQFHSKTSGGYIRYVHATRLEILIRPNGQVMRIERVAGQKWSNRYDSGGNQVGHDIGEFLGGGFLGK